MKNLLLKQTLTDTSSAIVMQTPVLAAYIPAATQTETNWTNYIHLDLNQSLSELCTTAKQIGSCAPIVRILLVVDKGTTIKVQSYTTYYIIKCFNLNKMLILAREILICRCSSQNAEHQTQAFIFSTYKIHGFCLEPFGV